MISSGRRRSWPARRIIALVVASVLVIVAFALPAWAVDAFALRSASDRFDVAGWELHHFPGKFLYGFDRLLHGEPSTAQENASLTRFFQLTHDIDALETAQSEADARGQPPDAAAARDLEAKRSERAGLQREVQWILERRLSKVIGDIGITRSAGLKRVVWPPVDFDFTDAPRMLAISPRDRIFLKSQTALPEGLSLAQVERIESATEKRDNVSALAFPLGGLGAYPTIVDYADDYLTALQVIAHEWTHNYLFFRPLGFDYSKNNDVSTMNETVADLVGHELAAEVVRRWPIEAAKPVPAVSPTPPPTTQPQASDQPAQPQQPRLDIGAELRELRGEVDDLLKAGKIDEAEALMEQRRQELATQGVRIRKINQAYFAFLNLYAGSAGNGVAVNPIGPKIDMLRRKSDSLRSFVDIVGDITSVADLDRALAR
jgi:hypothetical protein